MGHCLIPTRAGTKLVCADRLGHQAPLGPRGSWVAPGPWPTLLAHWFPSRTHRCGLVPQQPGLNPRSQRNCMPPGRSVSVRLITLRSSFKSYPRNQLRCCIGIRKSKFAHQGGFCLSGIATESPRQVPMLVLPVRIFSLRHRPAQLPLSSGDQPQNPQQTETFWVNDRTRDYRRSGNLRLEITFFSKASYFVISVQF